MRSVRPAAMALLGLLAACGDSPSAPGVPGIVAIDGHEGTFPVGTDLARPLLVEVRDQSGELARGIEFRFTVPPTESLRLGWTLTRQSQIDSTDQNGRASVRIGTGERAGVSHLRVEAPAISASVMIPFTLVPGPTAGVRLLQRDTGLWVGGMALPVARLVDRFGNQTPAAATFTTSSPILVAEGEGVRATGTGVGVIHAVHPREGGAGQWWVDSMIVHVVPQGTLYGSEDADSSRLVMVRTDGSGFRRLHARRAYDGGNGGVRAVRVSRDGARIAFHSWLDGTTRIFVMDSAGTPRRATPDDYGVVGEADPSFSADGEWIYYSAAAEAREEKIWRVRADGSAPPEPVFARGYPILREASPSPDGRRLVYASTAAEQDYQTAIRVLGLSTGRIQSAPALGISPRWAPDSEWVAYNAAGYGGYDAEVRIVRHDGTGDRPVPGAWDVRAWSGQYLLARVRGNDQHHRAGLVDAHTGTTYRFASFAHRLTLMELR